MFSVLIRGKGNISRKWEQTLECDGRKRGPLSRIIIMFLLFLARRAVTWDSNNLNKLWGRILMKKFTYRKYIKSSKIFKKPLRISISTFYRKRRKMDECLYRCLWFSGYFFSNTLFRSLQLPFYIPIMLM